ncbi:MAG: branched-chain amino acid ABC transporter permease [Desulfarculus sp.]|jgi:branched-chain amino acid transport system permease protein|nr:MAG: branched-chain amino acid ABC transporter permease [Desulfarculus sp.]
MSFFLELVANGVAVGGVYALIALGFVLIYKATSIINFATGEFMMIGAYFFYTFMVLLGLPAVPAFILVMACSALLGLVVERAILRHMLGQPTISIIMVTIGLSSILLGLAELIWTSDFKSFPPLFPRAPVIIGEVVIRSNFFWGFIIAMAAVAAFALLFKYAKVGVAMRATADDQMAAFSMGINVRSMFTVAWAMGAIAAALGGLIIGNIGGIQPNLGHLGLTIFPVVILGGLDSIAGAVVGGFIVGIVENLAGGYLHDYVRGDVKELAPFVVLVLILLIKPYGLFGKQEIERL